MSTTKKTTPSDKLQPQQDNLLPAFQQFTQLHGDTTIRRSKNAIVKLISIAASQNELDLNEEVFLAECLFQFLDHIENGELP